MDEINSYHDIKIDPREILEYLNDQGIRNISGKMLKEFINDLKRLIKFDLRHKQQTSHEEGFSHPEGSVFNRLYSTTTVSSRNRASREKKENEPKDTKLLERPGFTKTKPVPLHPVVKNRSKSCELLHQNKKKPTKQRISVSTCNLIKAPPNRPQRKSDPVSLYHYYLMLWARYRDNMPGENDRSGLRWEIRQKLMGDAAAPSTGTGGTGIQPTKKNEDLQKKREGWID